MVSASFRASQETIEVGGLQRTFTLLVPESASTHPPLLLLFHGSQQSSRVFRKFTDGSFDALARRTGAVLACPDGVERHFNDARREADFACRRQGVDDVAFTAAVIARLVRTQGVDRSRVFAVGYSNGGQMVLRLLHDAPKLLAGAATVAATQPAPENFAPTHPQARPVPVPVLAIHGTADPLAPYQGGEASLWGAQSRGAVLSARESAAYLARRNGAPGSSAQQPVVDRPVPDVLRERWAGTAPVELWSVQGMGHVVPAGNTLPDSLGPGTRTFVAADAIGRFFGLEAEAGSPASPGGRPSSTLQDSPLPH